MVFDDGERVDRLDDEADFFGELSSHAVGGGFAGFALAAGELPVAAETGVGGAAADKQLAVVFDDTDGDVGEGHGGECRRGVSLAKIELFSATAGRHDGGGATGVG